LPYIIFILQGGILNNHINFSVFLDACPTYDPKKIIKTSSKV